MPASRRILLAGAAMAAPARPGLAQDAGLVTVPSPHSVPETIARFADAVRAGNWVVFTVIDHAAAAQAVGMTLRPRSVVLFGNPRAGTPGMAATPQLAIDLPMRVLIWQDDAGHTQVTRSTGQDIATRIFARHGITIPPEGQRMTEALLAGLVAQAVG